ncbi:RodZ domain-containing protein [Nocardioides sp. LHG3406-4]|uniref:helix-turn-helix domain-containing protein n=1 Tax=Nocardioides sp. LHG3406-4 TaxID=2804575 RepID=UPI003CF160BD
MSATEVHDIHDPYDDDAQDHRGRTLSMAPGPVEVRRNAGLAAAVGAVASTIAIMYLRRAVITGSPLDWVLAAAIGALGIGWLAALVDARTPLLVADAQGVRIRLGRSWRGLPWGAVARVEHTPRAGLRRDGRLVVVPHNPERLVEELDASASRRARLSSWLYGAPLAMPLGLATRVVGTDDLAASLAALADRNTELVVIDADPEPDAGSELPQDLLPGQTRDDESDDSRPSLPPLVRDPRPLLALGIARVSALLPRREQDEHEQDDHEQDGEVDEDLDETAVDTTVATPTPDPTRAPVVGARAEVRHVDEAPATRPVVEMVEDDQVWGDRVRPIAREGNAVAPLVMDELGIEPASDPVVGPELRAARTRLSLTVDQLAERTRIRPHVIEAIEVDDFVPCGGDFYARGHLRTLCRVLGIDVAPLLTAYDDRYAHAPIDPRRVFEAELATGSHGSIRGTRGGPNWSIVVAVVMALVLAWSIARLVMDAPSELRGVEPVLNGSGGPHGGSAKAADPVPVEISAVSGGAHIVVRDSTGAEVFRGNLAIGESKIVKASPPLRVQTSDGAVTVSVDGRDRGAVGEPGEAVQGTYAAE